MGLRVCKPLSKFRNSFLRVLVRIQVPGAIKLGAQGIEQCSSESRNELSGWRCV